MEENLPWPVSFTGGRPERFRAQHRDVESCRRGDGDAFRVLYDLYKDKVYSISLYFFYGDEGLDTGSYLPYIVG
jgi:hypothetical protein